MTYIIGNLPPPIGGVSVFLKRHSAQYRLEGKPFRMVEWIKLSTWQRWYWVFRMLLDPRPASFEINGPVTIALFALVFRPFPKHVVYWVHSGQFTGRLKGIRRWIFSAFLQEVDECVLVSEHIYGLFEANGFTVPPNNRVQYAFLPPPPEDEPAIWQTYDEATLSFVDTHRPLLVMQGADSFHNGVDRYGTDVAVHALPHLLEQYPKVGLLVGHPSVGSTKHQAYFEQLLQYIADHDLSAHIHFMTGERELWPLLKRADLFLRPSNQDGDSITIREALMFDTPVIASDACPRAPGCILFANRNAEDLAHMIDHVWKDLQGETDPVKVRRDPRRHIPLERAQDHVPVPAPPTTVTSKQPDQASSSRA